MYVNRYVGMHRRRYTFIHISATFLSQHLCMYFMYPCICRSFVYQCVLYTKKTYTNLLFLLLLSGTERGGVAVNQAGDNIPATKAFDDVSFAFGEMSDLPSDMHYRTHVCIEAANKDELKSVSNINYTTGTRFQEVIARKVVIYHYSREGKEEIQAGGPIGVGASNKWAVEYRSGAPPPTHHYVDYPALFVTLTCEANLAHFLEDTLTMAYQSLKKSGRLSDPNPGKKVMLLYNKDSAFLESAERGCHGMRYQDMLLTLPIRPDHSAYYKVPEKTCFPDAVFGGTRRDFDRKEFSAAILKGLWCGIERVQGGDFALHH